MALPTVTVEIAFATNPGATPTWTDVTSYVRAWSTRRGRQHELDRVEAGTASVTLRNTDGRFTPSNASGPYYPNVKPMRRIRIRATWNSTTYDVFAGYIEGWPQSWTRGPSGDAQVELPCVDGFKMLSLAGVILDRPIELAGARIAAVLGLASWPLADRALDIGLSELQTVIPAEVPQSVSALGHLQDVADSDGGVLFISRDGKVVFYDRAKPIFTTLNTTDYTWDETSGHAYVDVVFSYDDSRLWNDVQVTAANRDAQSASDSTSQTTYLKRTLSQSTVLNSENDMDSRADHMLAKYKDPENCITSLEIDARGDTAQWPYLLGSELQDLIRVVKSPVGGGTITQDSFIEGIDHDFTPTRWRTTWRLSPRDPTYDATAWILEDAVKGKLGDTTTLYW